MRYGRDYFAWQPPTEFEIENGLEITVVYISKEVSMAVPTYLIDNILAWTHEFVELAIIYCLDEFIDPFQNITIITSYHIPEGLDALDKTEINSNSFPIPHIIASLTTFSGISGVEKTSDEFWEILKNSPTVEKIAREATEKCFGAYVTG